MTVRYADKLRAVQQVRVTTLGLLIAPRLTAMPLPIQRYDDPFLPFGKALISATRDLVCAYVFDLAAYLAIGAAGAVALERTIAYARADGETVCVLHAPFATGDYAAAASDAAFAVDAVTLTADAPIESYLANPQMGAYITDGQRDGAGQFDVASGILTTPDTTQPLIIRLLGESITSVGRDDDFEAVIRAAVEAER